MYMISWRNVPRRVIFKVYFLIPSIINHLLFPPQCPLSLKYMSAVYFSSGGPFIYVVFRFHKTTRVFDSVEMPVSFIFCAELKTFFTEYLLPLYGL